MKRIVEMLVVLLVLTSMILVCAADNNTTTADPNITAVDTPAVNNPTDAPNTSAVTDTPAATDTHVQEPAPVTTPVVVQAPVNGKIRVAPTVQLRTLNSKVTQDSDAVIDCYMSNPPANDGDLVVFITTEVPSGILFKSSQGSDEGNLGISETQYTIKPGYNKNIQLHAICSETGRFPVTMNVQYYVGTDKDSIKTIGLATEFTVVEPSTQFHMNDNKTQTPDPTPNPIIGGITLTTTQMEMGAGFVLLLIAIIGLALRR